MFQRFKTQRFNLICLGLMLAVAMLGYVNHVPRIYWLYIALFGILVCMLASVFHYWRFLKMSEAPISSIASAAQGYVELYGQARTEKPLKTPYHGIPCVWFRAWVFSNQQGNHQSHQLLDNRLLDYQESRSPFVLEDESGQCVVNPDGAEVIYYEARTWRKNNHRYVEEYLPAHQSIYVIGVLDTRKDMLDSAKLNKEVSAHLKALKQQPSRLLNLYDHDLNGEIDLHEWELARQDAIRQVQSTHAMQAHTAGFELAKPAGQQLFLISAKSPLQLRKNHLQWLGVYTSLLTFFVAAYMKLA